MTQSITSYLQTIFTRYDFENAILASVTLCFETVGHTYVYCSSKNNSKAHNQLPSHLIGLFKNLQTIASNITPAFTFTPTLLNVKNLIPCGVFFVVFEIFSESHMFPRTTENLLSHRVVCGLSHAVNITAKALNIIATGALLRRYSLTAMVAGGLAMTILSGANLWYDWQQLDRLRGDYKVSVGSKHR